jgi:rod shape-determining protein MreD
VGILRAILVAFVVAVVQMTIVKDMAIAGSAPDLMIILLVALVLERGPVPAVIIGFLLGILQDLGNASFLGMNALSKSIVAYGVSRIGGALLPENVLYRGLIIFIASLVNDCIVLAVTTSFSFVDILKSFFRFSLASAVYSALLGICIFVCVELVTRRVVRPRGGF